jgi:catecholate siderophore receptor
VNPTVIFTPGDKTAIRFSYENFQDRRVADRGIPSYNGLPADTAIETFFGDPDNSRVRAGVNIAATNIEHQAGRFTIRNHTMFGDYDRFYQNYVPGAVSADKTRVALSAYNNATKRKNLFNQTDVTFTAVSGRLKHNFLVGSEIGQQRTNNFRNTGFFNNTATSIQFPYSNPTVHTPITFRQSATDADNRVHTNLGAAYVQDQVELSRKLQVVAGGRFDYFDLQFHNNRNGQDLRRIDRLFAPRAGVIFKPVGALSLYGNYSVAYLPSSGDQFSSLTVITQQVKPEKFTNYEVGAKWDLVRKLSFTTALYRQDRTNTRATDPNDPTRILQTGSQRTNGFELSFAGQVTSKWTVNGGYALQDAYISSATTAAPAGAHVALVPRHNFSVWNNYRLIPRLSFGFGVIHRSDVFASIDNTVLLPGYTSANAAVFFSINESWRLQANFQNAFDTKYFLHADGNNNITPGAPRSAKVSLVARF